MRLDIIESDHADRAEVEAFIRATFFDVYRARVNLFMPHLVRLRTLHDHLVAVVGYRDAANHSLFLEKYLDRPVEDVLSAAVGQPVRREDVVEVGNLADAAPGGARAAIIILTAFLHSAGYRWVVFTGVPKLRNAFGRLGLDPIELTPADPMRLTAQERETWGSYYAGQPLVMAGDIRHGFESLDMLRRLLLDTWQDAMSQGRTLAKQECMT
ncbi:MAG TPA: thermostable hemolysin [Mariprofundaceae bacterium]|nr:thermostable hemolysin [Mariprofundaceae bacterium]